MRTVAFYFAAQSAALSAHAELRSANGLVPGEVEVAPLVVDGQNGSVVAFVIEDSDVSQVVDIASRHDGRLVVDVPEEWTHSRLVN